MWLINLALLPLTVGMALVVGAVSVVAGAGRTLMAAQQ